MAVFIIPFWKKTSLEQDMQKEKEFHLTQVLIGMRIRIQSGREKPIDRILKNILLLDVLISFYISYRK